ncbi:MAG: serine/threonine-protein kinase [Myxococcota bacterium]
MVSASSTGVSADAPTAIVDAETDASGSRAAEPAFVPPEAVDRYVIGRQLGAGGLGIVFEAWDPELERTVAVKLVRPRTPGTRGPERFLREAQALARLNHPNVVSVFGVGTCDDAVTVYVVMQFIDGVTLGAWSGEERSYDEILAVFLAAGRGLVAAHAAGIVHRDFKPDNVMIDAAGKVHVLDFGLALVAGPGTRSVVESMSGLEASNDLDESFDERLTQEGVVMGTPRYMAPEQHRGTSVGPAADQFSFCVAMLRTLRRGRVVYEAKGNRALASAKLRGMVTPPHEDDLTPSWMEAVLMRGLSPRPQDRWPSMRALLEALEQGPRRRWPLVAGAAGLLVAGGLALLPARDGQDCDAGSERLATLAEHANEDGLASALNDALGDARGRAVRGRLTTSLDADAEAWAAAYVGACTDHRAGVVDDVAFDRRMACLRARAVQRERLVAGMQGASRQHLMRLPEAMLQLDGVQGCADDESLKARNPLPQDPGARAQVIDARAELSTVSARARDGEFERALRLIEAQETIASSLGFEPLLAEVHQAVGQVRTEAGEYTEAAEAYEQALTTAEGSGHDRAAAMCASALVFLYAARLDRTEDAQRLLSHAKALVERAGSTPDLRRRLGTSESVLLNRLQSFEQAKDVLEALVPTLPTDTPRQRHALSTVLNNLGLHYQRLGHYAKAVETLQRALALRTEALGTDHPKNGGLQLNIGNTLIRSSKYSESEPYFERAIALIADGYGEQHVELSRPYISRGVARKKQGKFDEARADYERALEILRGKNQRAQEAMVLANLGNVDKRTGRLESALQRHQEALAIREAVLGSDSLRVADSLSDIGSLHRRAKRYDQARANYARAAEIKRTVHGPDHPEMVTVHLHAANLALDEEDLDTAKRALDEGLRVIAMSGSASIESGLTYQALGRLRMEKDEPESAAAALERSVAVLVSVEASPSIVGAARFDLAKAQWARGDAAKARDALSAARVELRNGGAGAADDLAALEAVASDWSGARHSKR